MLPAREPVPWHTCLDCPLPSNSRHTALDRTSEYSGCQTLCGVDHSPELLACAAPQQCPGAALLCHECNNHSNLHPTTHVGAINARFAPLNQVLHTWATCPNRFHCSYVNGNLTAVQRGNLYKHSQPLAHKKPLTLAKVFNHELIAGAHFFLAYGHSRLVPCHYPC